VRHTGIRSGVLASLCALGVAGLLIGCPQGGDNATPTLEAQVGQMLMIGFRGTEIGPADTVWRQIEKRNLAGVVLFRRDVPFGNVASPQQVARLNDTLQSIRSDTLLIAVDREGGIVRRLTSADGFPDSPSHATLGEQDDVETTRAAARGIADPLATHDLKMSFAPVAGVNTADAYDPLVADRAIDHIVRLVEEGRIEPGRIHRSWQRIQELKQRLSSLGNP